jgi:hypothetical protein
LALAGGGFLVAFAVQRANSRWLALEQDRATSVDLAKRHGLPVADVLALRWTLANDTPQHLEAVLATFAAERTVLGDPLAAVAALGDAAAARAARATAADAAAAWVAFRAEPAALPGLQFLHLRDRAASRTAARD